jgi:hypothetical protein
MADQDMHELKEPIRVSLKLSTGILTIAGEGIALQMSTDRARRVAFDMMELLSEPGVLASPGSVSDQGWREERPQLRRLVCKKCGCDLDVTMCGYGCELDGIISSERSRDDIEIRVYELLRVEPLPALRLPAPPVSPAQPKDQQ